MGGHQQTHGATCKQKGVNTGAWVARYSSRSKENGHCKSKDLVVSNERRGSGDRRLGGGSILYKSEGSSSCHPRLVYTERMCQRKGAQPVVNGSGGVRVGFEGGI